MNTLDKKMSQVIKDRTNILNKHQCVAFIKDYKDLINGKISGIKHPKTRKIIKNATQIKYVYDKCVEMFNIKSSVSSANLSKITKMAKLSSSSSTDLSIDYEKEIKTLNENDIEQIINIPIESHSYNRALIKSFFKVPISYKKGMQILKNYLNNPNNKRPDVNEYRLYVVQIASMIPKFNPFINRGEFTEMIMKAFSEYNKDKIMLFSDLCQKEFISAIFQDTRRLNMGAFTNHENYTAATESNFVKRLSQNKHYYFSLYYISRLVLHNTLRDPEIVQHMMFCKKIMRKLLNKDFILRDPSVSRSFSSSGSKSSDEEDRDSSMKTIYNQIGRREYVNYIMNNGENPRTVNETEPYLGVKWNDLSMDKLKLVVKISNILNGRRYTYAFYAKSLYTDWKNAVKQGIPFINPITRIPFTAEDERNILNVLDRKYPNIGIPKNSVQRSDIYYQEVEMVRENGVYFWRINIWFNIGNATNINYIRILCLNIITNLELYDDESRVEYSPAMLFYNIDKMKKRNKNIILGKKIPFKLHPAFAKYYNSYITTEEQYLDFFRIIERYV
jgi:hypothetical protein